MPESRRYNAEYYDLLTQQDADTKFYLELVSKDDCVLELGCGTGRVSLPIAQRVKEVTAVDISETMLERARSKDIANAVEFVLGDITSLDLDKKFNLVIAPFRVMQALETAQQVEGLFRVIRNHLADEGLCILNVFRPLYPRDEMAYKWPRQEETPISEVKMANGDILKSSDTRRRIDERNQVLHPEIIYRRYRDGKLIDEHVNPICMCYYYPEELKSLILKAGFEVTNSWGGYKGEVYGEGPELVVGFKKSRREPRSLL